VGVEYGSPQIRDFLLNRGSGRIPHPGGTLHEHLIRVGALLAEWGADEDLQAAGVCHACYGTDGFGRALMALSERPALADLIGARAEWLVYVYGSCDRDAVYPALSGPGPVRFRDRFTGRTYPLPEEDARAFAELTAANELDVVRHNADLAARHGVALRRLFAGARPRLSEAAARAWTPEAGAEAGSHSPSPVSISGLDHLVLTVTDLDRSIGFYQRVLGMHPVTFGAARRALEFGGSKINLHLADQEIAPHAARPMPGSADFCLVTSATPERVLAHLEAEHVPVELGPVPRTGARGPITSVYVRDPDDNLIEVASYPAGPAEVA